MVAFRTHSFDIFTTIRDIRNQAAAKNPAKQENRE